MVVIAGKSSEYTGPTGWAAAAAALTATAFVCWSPWAFNDLMIPVDAALFTAAVAAMVGTGTATRAWLARPARREAAVSLKADAAFWQEAVHATRARTGILVYVSVLERIVAVRADVAIRREVPAGKWTAATAALQASLRSANEPESFASALREMGKVLGEHLPRTDDDENESADAPRVRE